ncbi:MAG: alpha/beta hydrolase [Treponemataceae bacterium]
MNEYFIDYASIRVYVRDNITQSDKLPVVFLHGLGSASSIYDPAFAEPFLVGRTLCFDFPGFGKSDKPRDYSYALTEQAECLRAVLDKAGLERVTLVAHSMGGVIAILFAAAHPERVARLVLAEANLDPANAKISRKIADYGSEERFTDAFESFIGYYNRPHSPSAYRFYTTLTQSTAYSLYRSAASLVSHVDEAFYQKFLSLPMPRWFMRGGDSYHAFSAWMLGDLSAHGIPVVVIPHAGHSMMEDQPIAFFAALRDIELELPPQRK